MISKLKIIYAVQVNLIEVNMSNRDGRKAKRNVKSKFSTPNKICPVCQNTLDKCADHSAPGHSHHRYCKTCKYSNF